jgi:hypothetical protein
VVLSLKLSHYTTLIEPGWVLPLFTTQHFATIITVTIFWWKETGLFKAGIEENGGDLSVSSQ